MKKNALVIINPKSGRGKSIKVFNENRDFLDVNYNLEILITKYKHHIYDYFRTNCNNIMTKDLIISIGGDGITANANDIAITAAQTTITSVLS